MARKAKPARSSLTPFYAVLALVAVIGLGVLFYQMRGGSRGTAATRPVPVTLDPTELSRVQGISVGAQDAPVVIYEFADYQCPGCGQFATFVTPLVKERLVKDGTVRYVYYDFPLPSHAHSFLAARAARCANVQGKFWEYHDLLYARQPSWSGLSDATDFFVDLAGPAGVEKRPFEECLRSDQFAEEVTRNLRLGESLGVQGTPTIIINGKRLAEPPSYSELEELVRQEIGTPAPAASAETAQSPAGS